LSGDRRKPRSTNQVCEVGKKIAPGHRSRIP